MLIYREYDQQRRLDMAWYKSSNIFYSECEDRENELKVLRVTFNNGATYEYSDVNVHDYLMFMKGGTDGSNGKALNTFIKKNCKCVRLDSIDTAYLTQKRLLMTEAYYERMKKQDSASTES